MTANNVRFFHNNNIRTNRIMWFMTSKQLPSQDMATDINALKCFPHFSTFCLICHPLSLAVGGLRGIRRGSVRMTTEIHIKSVPLSTDFSHPSGRKELSDMFYIPDGLGPTV